MPSRISFAELELGDSINDDWRIIEEAEVQELDDAAARLVESGGDARYLADLLGADSVGQDSKEQVVICLHTTAKMQEQHSQKLADANPRLVPVAQFKKLVLTDRFEIEAYRGIHQLIDQYLSDRESKMPLAIAVFGPPGSGKSFGIKQVIESVSSDVHFLEFNLAQFTESSELSKAFDKIANTNVSGRVPIAFFDEFDSNDLDWLRYFLAPMQDAQFFMDGGTKNIGKAIFVFAGGTSITFEEFVERGNKVEDGGDSLFSRKKGPDFVSRLSGRINVLGVNPMNRDARKDRAFVLRRALIIRAELRRQKLIGRSGRALVDSRFLRRLICVEEYLHGARSIGKVMQMCIGPNGMLHLPPFEQLAMHLKVDDAESLVSTSVDVQKRADAKKAVMDANRS